MSELLRRMDGITDATPAQIASAVGIPESQVWHKVHPANEIRARDGEPVVTIRYWVGVVGANCASLDLPSDTIDLLQSFAADQSRLGAPVMWRRWDTQCGRVRILLWQDGEIAGRWTVNAQEFNPCVRGYDFTSGALIDPPEEWD